MERSWIETPRALPLSARATSAPGSEESAGGGREGTRGWRPGLVAEEEGSVAVGVLARHLLGHVR
eukprot:2367524-Rhodomonas_salina.2